jgi:glycosyltransferase involved in cell wall biosynthesis
LAQVGIRRPILWISTPAQFDARFDLPARLRVYHIVDDYLGYASLSEVQRASWAGRERALIDWADLVVTVSPELMETKGAGNPKFRLLPNAVDAAAYRTVDWVVPAALAELPRPLLGYIGLIGVRLDLALLNALAAAHPEWTLALLGEVDRSGCGEALDRLAGRPNVRLLPPVPGDQVAGYVRAFDLGLLPYRRTQETHHASPLKLYEYLAAGLPVVAADVPGARQFADVVAIASDLPSWEVAITTQLTTNTSATSAARQAAVAPHTWDARVETLSIYLAEALAHRAREDGRTR